MAKINIKADNLKRSTDYKKTKRYLLDFIVEKGIDTPIFNDKIETYLTFWVSKKIITDELSNIAIGVDDQNGNGAKIDEIAKELCKIDTQMSKILKEIGIDYVTSRKKVKEDAL